jgi:nickel-dependent lactate racemase
MLYIAQGSENAQIGSGELKSLLYTLFERLGPKKNILIIPPDFTRFHSQAGEITRIAHTFYGKSVKAILPALGTHFPMTDQEISQMFSDEIPRELYRVHDWRNDVYTLGEIPSSFIHSVSDGLVDYSIQVQVNKLLVEGKFDLILSIGQVVPHEVIGMANYNKNILVGAGGSDIINKSHFLGAAFGMERIMGRADTPVRAALNYATDRFLADLPIVYIQTVIGKDKSGGLPLRGVYAGDDIQCFNLAADLSLRVNFELLEEPLEKVVVYLDPGEFKSTWLGNKSIYRTRMAIADGGELIILAPGIREFGEDREIDRLIRKYGYRSTPDILESMQRNEDLRTNLAAAAHLIHGSAENRFRICYCPGKLSLEEIEEVNYHYGELDEMMQRYDPSKLVDGYNILASGERVFFISNPALGLWAHKDRFFDE